MEKVSSTSITKENIAYALVEIIKRKDFESITITEIAEEANVGRVTVYRNFSSKEAILKYYFDIFAKRFKIPAEHITSTDDSYYGAIIHVLNALKRNRGFIKRIIEANITSVVLDYIDEQYIRMFESRGKDYSPFIPYLYSGAVFNLARRWVCTGCEATVDEVADAIFTASHGRKYQKISQ